MSAGGRSAVAWGPAAISPLQLSEERRGGGGGRRWKRERGGGSIFKSIVCLLLRPRLCKRRRQSN